MKGFFNLKPTTRTGIFTPTCGQSCTLNKGCHSPKMPVTGKGQMGILVIAEAPGEHEDARNVQLIGPAGQVLRTFLSEYGVDLDRDCRKTNAVRCRPPANRKPTNVEIEACQQHIWDEIKEHPPKVILLLGQVALDSFLLDRVRDVGAIGRWRGFAIPDQKTRCYVVPTFHPSYILRSREAKTRRTATSTVLSAEERVFGLDIEKALSLVKRHFPVTPTPVIADEWTIKKGDTIAFDYETTGLRPYRKGHRIVSVGISNGEWCYAGEMTNDFARKWKFALQAEDIKKTAFNMKFEHQWGLWCLGVETRGWVWDPMIAAHIVDNRRGICSLEFQTYITLGVETWKTETAGTFDENEDGFNQYKNEHPTPDLLRRNALDAYYTFLLFPKQWYGFYNDYYPGKLPF